MLLTTFYFQIKHNYFGVIREMALPTWEEFCLPVLKVLSDGVTRDRRELHRLTAHAMQLTAEQKAETISSGKLKFQNRIGWATSYLTRTGALERPMRGHYCVTATGRQLIVKHPEGITEKHLAALVTEPGELAPWRVRKSGGSLDAGPEPQAELDPVEQVEEGIARIHADVADDLLSRLRAQEPAFFEQAVVDLVIAMGYGGGDSTATRTQLSNDGGIDGIVDQDALGLSRVFIQAKRYAEANSVGRPDVQAFVGALHGAQANQGVFITTGRFTQGAREYADAVGTRVVLIDGTRLSTLLIRYGVGVQVKRSVQIVEVDEDFFE